MLKKAMVVTLTGLGFAVMTAGTASADAGDNTGDGFGGSITTVGGEQSGLLVFNAPVADGRCLAPDLDSAVAGGTVSTGAEDTICSDVKSNVEQEQSGRNALLLF